MTTTTKAKRSPAQPAAPAPKPMQAPQVKRERQPRWERLRHDRPVKRWSGPRCELHGHNIVNALPDGCPLRAASIMAELQKRQDLAFIAGGIIGGSRYRRILDICTGCVDRLLGDPFIDSLRAEAQDDQADARGAHGTHGAQDQGQGTPLPSQGKIFVSSKRVSGKKQR